MSSQQEEIERLREALGKALDGLDEIALAGMSGVGFESKEAMTDWHARRAWEFIGIAARAKDDARSALSQSQSSCNGVKENGNV